MADSNGGAPRMRSKYADIPLPPAQRQADAARAAARQGGGRVPPASPASRMRTAPAEAAAHGDDPALRPIPVAAPAPPTSPAHEGGYARASSNAAAAPRRRRADSTRARHRRGRRLPAFQPALLAIAAVVGAFILIGAVDLAANWGRIYPGVHIGSVDVSGMTAPEAQAAVQDAYGSRVGGGAVSIYADEETLEKARNGQEVDDSPQASEYVSVEEAARSQRRWTADATSLQARLAVEDLVEEALEVGREDGGPLGRLAAQALGREVDPRVQMNDAAVESLASDIDRAIGEPRRDSDIEVEYGEATVVDGHDGWEVDRGWLRGELESQLLSDQGDRSFAAHVEYAPQRIGRDAAQAAADAVNAGIAGGATFSFNGTYWNASAYDLGNLVTTSIEADGDGWTLRPRYEESAAKNAILTHLQSSFSDQDIKVEFVKSGDSVMVRTNAEGTMPEAGDAVGKLEAATLADRPQDTPTIEVEGTQIPSAMSIQAAMDYGIITTISEYETEYTGGATARNTNIHLAADLLDNSIIPADGGEWSFNGTAGECNEEKGFQGAGSIVNGETVDEIGGGICQVATTVFNAVFEAGYPIDERTNHSLYIASYPAGRDAAINWPDLDLRWHNDTGNDILLQTDWTDTTITVRLIGVDPGYTVESETGEFEKGAEHGTRTEEDPDLPAGATEVKQAGQDGSSITVKRSVKDGTGRILRQDEFVSVYDAKDEIIVTGSRAAGEDAS